MQIKRIGHTGYKLYTLGWRNALHRQLSPFQHRLLSVFLYYRHGFENGSEWVGEYHLERNLR